MSVGVRCTVCRMIDEVDELDFLTVRGILDGNYVCEDCACDIEATLVPAHDLQQTEKHDRVAAE